jgi:hypothetical protein
VRPWIPIAAFAGVMAGLAMAIWLLVQGLRAESDGASRIQAASTLIATFGIGALATLLWVQAALRGSPKAIQRLRRDRFAAVERRVNYVMDWDYEITKNSTIPTTVTYERGSPFAMLVKEREAFRRLWHVRKGEREGVLTVSFWPEGPPSTAVPGKDYRPMFASIWQYGDTCHIGMFLYKRQIERYLKSVDSELSQADTDRIYDRLRTICWELLIRQPKERRPIVRHELELIELVEDESDLLLSAAAWDRIAVQVSQFASHVSIELFNLSHSKVAKARMAQTGA